MELHQIQTTYRPEEDRLLLRASFRCGDAGLQEVRAWLTRRMVCLLWQGIGRVLENRVLLEKPAAIGAGRDLVGMEHETSVAAARDQGSFSHPFCPDATVYPLGETPFLVTELRFTPQMAAQPLKINFAQAGGQGFEIGFGKDMLHAFCDILKEAVDQADWDVSLKLVQEGSIAPEGAILN